MLTLLGGLLGFVGSAIPDVIGMFKDKGKRKHELDMLNARMKAASQGHKENVQEINATADIAETKAIYIHAGKDSGVPFIEGLIASVRPVVTYLFVFMFLAVKSAALYNLTIEGATVAQALLAIWDSETMALFATILSFWFGQRALTKFRGNK